MALCSEFEEESCVSLAQTIERHVTEAAAARAAGNEDWWKLHEAVMLALGSAQDVIEEQISARKVNKSVVLLREPVTRSSRRRGRSNLPYINILKQYVFSFILSLSELVSFFQPLSAKLDVSNCCRYSFLIFPLKCILICLGQL